MNRTLVYPRQLDLVSKGRRDYLVRFEHPTLWGEYLIPLTVFVGAEAQQGRGVVAIGATHGDEYEGPVAIKNLLTEIKWEEVSGRVILIPTLNVPAFEAGTRDTPDDGGNLNRAFPGDESGTLTQRFAHFISESVFPNVHVVLDQHAGGRVARFVVCVGFHAVKDPEQQKAMEQTARGFGTRFVNYYQDETPGLLTSAAERRGKITLGGEYGWGQSINPEGVARIRQGILNALHGHEQWKGSPPAQACTPAEEQILVDFSDRCCYLPSPRAGHFEPLCLCGDYVKKGKRIGWVHDFNHIDDPPLAIEAPHDGYVISQAWQAKVFKGQVVSVVAPRRAWAR